MRMAQAARRLPRLARAQRYELAAACEVAGMLADAVGAPPSVPGLPQPPDRALGRARARCAGAKGEQIPLPMRIVHVAKDAALQRLLGGAEHAVRLMRERAGHAFDPEVAACLIEDGDEILARDEGALGVGRGARPGAAATADARGRRRSLAGSARWGTSPT